MRFGFLKLAALAALVRVLTFNAYALSITPATLPQYSGPENSQSAINTAIAPYIGSAPLLYKGEVGGAEEGSLAGSYETTFSNSASDPTDALIEYISGQYVGAPAWLLVKDGDANPGWYLFNLSTLGWNGTDDLVLTGFWPGKGAISHVSLYGTAVPDGAATAALLGLGLISLTMFSRKDRKSVANA